MGNAEAQPGRHRGGGEGASSQKCGARGRRCGGQEVPSARCISITTERRVGPCGVGERRNDTMSCARAGGHSGPPHVSHMRPRHEAKHVTSAKLDRLTAPFVYCVQPHSPLLPAEGLHRARRVVCVSNTMARDCGLALNAASGPFHPFALCSVTPAAWGSYLDGKGRRVATRCGTLCAFACALRRVLRLARISTTPSPIAGFTCDSSAHSRG